MQKQVLLCPDSVVLERAAKKNAVVSEGALSKQLVYAEPSEKLDLGKLVNATNGEVKVFLADYSEQAKLPVHLIIPSVASYLALHISNNEVDAPQVNTLLKTWQSYFEACKQLLLMHPDAFVAKGISVSAHINIREAAQHALNNDDALLQLHEDWSTFVAKKDRALRPLNKYLSELGADLREVARLRSEVERLCGERDDIERKYIDELKLSASELAELKSENELLLLQIAQLQEELEEVYLKGQSREKEAQGEIARLEAEIESSSASKGKQDELETENELLLLQIAQLQEELEHYFLEYNKAIAGSKPKKPKGPKNQIMILQSSIEHGNERLTIRIKNLHVGERTFNLFDLSIGAKRVRDDGFSNLGVLELRVLPGKKAPLQDWKPNKRDRWGRKLYLEVSKQPEIHQKTQVEKLSLQDRKFLRELLALISEGADNISLNGAKLNRPMQHWQSLLLDMSTALDAN
ncbi:hypothetical protein ACFO4O_12635 [Glaciecola siphonariae]|uniref:Uncharacterized protein n=1 Tax=Glaciecola siphonariae TaxID=521012 RepID=A0ABV9LWS6_9ALTE